MTMLYIQSRGEIDPNALTLMGASVKDEGGIGEFGSGWKYSIACLLRNKLALRIWSGTREIAIAQKAAEFRGESFNVIYVDGARTSITTRTGPKWNVRDAVREIWSNALDEGGAKHSTAPLTPEPGTTTVAIELTDEIKAMLCSWSQYFCKDEPALFECMYGRILKLPIQNFYRRGVWICEDRDAIGHFSYDFKDFNLPESRIVSSTSAIHRVYAFFWQCNNKQIWNELLDNQFAAEWKSLYVNWPTGVGLGALKSAFAERYDFVGSDKNRDRLKAMGRVLWCKNDQVYTTLLHCGIRSIERELKHSDLYEPLPWPIGFEPKVRSAVETLKRAGIDLTPFNITFGKITASENIIALADTETGTCILGNRALEIDSAQLMKALVEEWTHLEHNVTDGSISQQHVYLDTIVRLIEGK